MAESTSTLNEDINEPMSPDLFSEDEIQDPEPQNMEESNSTDHELELTDDSQEWKGTSMDEIHRGLDLFHYEQPPIRPSEYHTVLFEVDTKYLPIPNRGPPKPFPLQPVDKWSVNYVRMPHSPKCQYTTHNNCDEREYRIRWEVIQDSLLQSFVSSMQLEAAILSYNNKYASQWNFNALHSLLEDMDEDDIFFKQLLPKIIRLALQLPTLVTGPIPLLKQHSNDSISLSQLQVASLLANALLCTFPRRNASSSNSEYASYPLINFNRLFAAYEKHPRKLKVVTEKLKCIFHYFKRVTASRAVGPEGTITIQRRFVPKDICPKWDKVKYQLPQLHITSKGTIEDEGAGLLQVDFANKYIGGGVLNSGCVQEEIRFVICPELLVTMLVTEVLDDTEALIITGAERYSNYSGYSDTFEWAGNYVDETPRDSSGRRKTSIVAIDALFFHQANRQYNGRNIIRELNKAYVGFSSHEMSSTDLPGIATGNWGCGAFRGDPHIKSLIQLMAAAVNQRSIAYFTFGNKKLRDDIAEMYWYLVQHEVNVGRLFNLLRAYESESTRYQTLYEFLYKRAKIKPLMKYFNVLPSMPISFQKNSEKVSIKKCDTNPVTVTIKKSSIETNKSSKLKQEDDEIRHLLEKDDDLNIEDSELIEKDSPDSEETSGQKWDLWENKRHTENKNIEDSSTCTIETKDNKKSLWEFTSSKETQEDRLRIEAEREHRIGLEALNKLTAFSSESEDGLTNNFLLSDSDNEAPKPVDKLKNLEKIDKVDPIPDPLIYKQVDNGSETTSNINNCKVKKSSSPQKSGHSNYFGSGQKKILDYFSRKK